MTKKLGPGCRVKIQVNKADRLAQLRGQTPDIVEGTIVEARGPGRFLVSFPLDDFSVVRVIKQASDLAPV